VFEIQLEMVPLEFEGHLAKQALVGYEGQLAPGDHLVGIGVFDRYSNYFC
jgi:hypothetical protein